MNTIQSLKIEPKNFGQLSQMKLDDVFGVKSGYINELSLFVLYFNCIPNTTEEVGINCLKAAEWFVQNYKQDIIDIHYRKYFETDSWKVEFSTIYIVAFDDLLIRFNVWDNTVSFLYKRTDINAIERLIAEIKKNKKRTYKRREPKISLLLSIHGKLELKTFRIEKPKLNIADNYNHDFLDVHKQILKRLSEDNKKGLVLLHGKPGTGKTFYIRHIIATIKKRVIFLSPDVAMELTNPCLLPLLIENPNSVLVIEDAEKIISSRNNNENSNVAALLNVTDGLLSDCLNIQIICSFNTDISKIDTALLRKGRLIAKYEFKELETEKANQLAQKIGINEVYNEPVALTNIYNHNDMNYSEAKRNKIGFGVMS
jgi:translation initiation factor 2 beta subunit (eIF-2beta)/eIF-5